MAVEDSNTKRCTKCGEHKQLSLFYKGVRYKDGLHPWCKPCHKVGGDSYRARNPEKISAYSKKWRSENKDKVRAWGKAYEESNRDKIRARKAAEYSSDPQRKLKKNAEWAAKNRDKLRQLNAAWYERHRENHNARFCDRRKQNPEIGRIIAHNYRARKRNNGGQLSTGLSDRLFALQKGKCACCGKKLGDDYHLDHIVQLALCGTNTDDNIQLLRAECNLRKSAKHPVDFMRQRGFLL